MSPPESEGAAFAFTRLIRLFDCLALTIVQTPEHINLSRRNPAIQAISTALRRKETPRFSVAMPGTHRAPIFNGEERKLH